MIKEKKCKGQGLALGYGCGKMVKVENRVYGLGKMCCYSDWLMNSENGKIKLSKAINKVQKPRLDFEKLELESKYKSKLNLALKNTKTFVHAFVRKRDENKPCISCGCNWNRDFQAGHFYPAGSFETLRFNLYNINGQCVQCNIHNEGNFENYSLNLPKRIGAENYNELVKLAGIDKQFSKVWDLDNLKGIIKNIKK
jgi:hypothetical protein